MCVQTFRVRVWRAGQTLPAHCWAPSGCPGWGLWAGWMGAGGQSGGAEVSGPGSSPDLPTGPMQPRTHSRPLPAFHLQHPGRLILSPASIWVVLKAPCPESVPGSFRTPLPLPVTCGTPGQWYPKLGQDARRDPPPSPEILASAFLLLPPFLPQLGPDPPAPASPCSSCAPGP